MQYDQALKHGSKVGARRAEGDSMLALTCASLAAIHAIDPRMVYDGAKKKHLTHRDVYRLAVDDPVTLGDLMFV